MAKFIVEVARDATIRFRAEVEAENIEEVQSHMHNHGYAGPIQGEWVQHSDHCFDNVEEYVVYKPETYEILYLEERR